MTAIERLRTLATRLGTPAIWLLGSTMLHAETPVRWAVCYSDRPDAESLARFDLVVLDPVRHPALAPLQERHRTVLSYLSLTEMGGAHDAFADLSRRGVVLQPHPAWNGTHFLDVRHPEWQRTVLDVLVPRALAAGFDGLFLDTLDDAEFLERQEAGRFDGTRAAAVGLVKAIRARHPDIVLMVNRGYALMVDLAPVVDIVLGESVLTTFDADMKSFRWRSDSDIAWQVDALRAIKASHPRVKLLTLDYWDPADRDTVRRIYERQRANGFSPYVATPMLDVLVEEPQ